MKAYSRGKNYFQRSIAHSVFRDMSCGKQKSHLRQTRQGEKTMKVGKYKILLDEVLGSGYSCTVYKGIEEGQLKRYAIKVIQLKNFSSFCLKLFERQIAIHRTLKHDHIVKCYDVIRTKTHIYMVMEYCPHGDLATYISQKKKLPEHSIIDIMNQIIDGPNYLAK